VRKGQGPRSDWSFTRRLLPANEDVYSTLAGQTPDLGFALIFPNSRGPSCCIIPPNTFVATTISASPAQDSPDIRLRRHILCTALWVAGLANVLIPALLFSVAQFFGPTDPRYRVLVAVVVVAEYAIAWLLILLHANVGFAAGYTAATAVTVTAGSAVLAYITLTPARWSSSGLAGEILVAGGFAFAVLSNVAFLVASIRYGRAIHPRLHLGGFSLGIAAYVALIVVYVRFFHQ
jgi:hypothetical protein